MNLDNITGILPINTPKTIGPRGSEIPIIASSMVIDIKELVMPDGKNANYTPLEKAMDELKECGFNGFIAKINYDYLDNLLPEVLSMAQAKNMFVIILSNAFNVPSDELLNLWKNQISTISKDEEKAAEFKKFFDKRISNFLEKCEGYSSFGGVSLNDEPTLAELQRRYIPIPNSLNFNDFNSINGSYYCLSNRYKIIQSLLSATLSVADNTVIMVNLVGLHNSEHVAIPNDTDSKEYDYEGYLTAFSRILMSPNKYPYLWSYDIYPIRERSYLLENNHKIAMEEQGETVNDYDVTPLDENGQVTVNYQDFYEDLRLFNEKTDGKGSIFWTYIQSMSYMAGFGFHPLAQEQYLRFAIFSSLAMGCQGIMHWTYHQRANQKTELYLSAPIDRQGRKTPVWYYAKKVNAEIRRYNSVFRGSKLEGYGHIGNIYDGVQLLTTSIGCVSRITAMGSGVLVTHLSNGDKNYIIIVNHDITEHQNILITFVKCSSIWEFTPNGLTSDNSQPIQISRPVLSRTLLPGGYLIYQYTI